MVPSTKGGTLKLRVEEVMKSVPGPKGQNVRVLEQPGPSIKAALTRNNPFPRAGCEREHCPLGGGNVEKDTIRKI